MTRASKGWTAAELDEDRCWVHRLAPAAVDELSRAADAVTARGLPEAAIGIDEVPLPSLRPTLEGVRRELASGRGVVLLRGVPVERHDLAGWTAIAIGLGAHLGRPIAPQGATGELVDLVADPGEDYGRARTKGYETRAALSPHCDSGDVAGLLCIRRAKAGGVTSIASFAAIHAEIEATRPDLLALLERGFHYNIRGGGPPGPGRDVTRHRVPVFVRHGDRVAGRFNGQAIRTAPEFPGVAMLTAEEIAAVALVEELALRPDLRFDMALEPGDLQLLSNHDVIHTRSAFEDHPEPDRKRLLLRIWIVWPEPLPLPDEFTDHYNTGPRGGPWVRPSTSDGGAAAAEIG